MEVSFYADGYFSNRGQFPGQEAQMRLDFDVKDSQRQILVRLLEARGYEDLSRTTEDKDAPCETGIYISYEDARRPADFLAHVLSSEQ